MNKKARLGLISVGASAILVSSIQHIGISKPDKPIVKHSTWKEKNENRKIAKTYARIGYGWTGREWVCLERLWSSESRFDSWATNPRSTARGIAQLLGEQSNDPRIQILRGLRYIDRRYGTPCKALAFHNRHNFY